MTIRPGPLSVGGAALQLERLGPVRRLGWRPWTNRPRYQGQGHERDKWGQTSPPEDGHRSQSWGGWKAGGQIVSRAAARLTLILLLMLLFAGCSGSRPVKLPGDRIRYWRDDRTKVCFATLLSSNYTAERVVSVRCEDVPENLFEESPHEDWRPSRDK